MVTDENGLYYMRARYYNVDIKRFINQDVLEGSIASSPSLNQYAYCQGNPVKLTDPFGLSPFTSWSVLGHGLLDVLGFIPVIGAIPDTVNALWYLAEGDHFSAAASFVSAVPGWGDVIGAVGKTAKGCSKVSMMVRYGSKIVGHIGNIALGSYQTGSIAVSLYDKHVVQGESWDWDSTVQLFSAGLFATTTVVSAKGLKGDVGEYRRVV
ncbi:RHS repeat-associated core domain-containing protein, partial [Thomasclavelia cocleata]|uniref:RHS repeat-associated core domain-containing protein n=1 Tax=Thomasclavelia cocleata TaxID=69824 RepID=UPI00255AE992